MVPVHPHTVLAPTRIQVEKARDAFDEAAQTIQDLEADLLIITPPHGLPSSAIKSKQTPIPNG